MVKGPIRGVLWVLGGLGVLWVVLVLSTTIGMGGMGGMGGGGMPGGIGMGGAPGGGSMMGGGSMAGGAMAAMWGVMLTQALGMLGLAGVFVYLVVDSVGRNVPTAETDERIE